MAGRLVLLLREEHNRIRNNRIFRDRQNPIDYLSDRELYRRYRFDRESIIFLTDIIINDLNHTRRTNALLPIQQVLIALRYYATGTFHIVCGDDARVTKQTAHRCIWTVTNSLLKKISEFISFPPENYCDRIKSDFYQIAAFPGVLGLIDGTHIRIQRPTVNENEYINRKFFPSINVQGICDCRGRYLNVCAKWPGSTHDAFVWSQSSINRQFEADGRDDGYLLGDSGYPCKPWLLTPFRQADTESQNKYNKAHRRTRVIIEQTFGRWKRRFHLMHGEIRTEPENACKLIIATAMLHNIAIDRNQPDFDGPMEEDDLAGIEIADFNEDLGLQNGKNFRQHIVNCYFG